MPVRLNVALKTAIIQSRKKQKRIAKLTRIPETRLSRIVRGHETATPRERQRLSVVLERDEATLFPDDETCEAVSA